MRKTALFLFLILFTASCTDTYETMRFYSDEASFEITHKRADEPKEAEKTIRLYEKQISSFENDYNNALTGSSFPIAPIWEVLFKKSFDYQTLSKGRYDLRAYSLSSLYGFPDGPFVIPDDEKKAAVKEALKNRPLTFVDGRLVKDDERIRISAEAFSTGYLIDKAADTLKENNIDSALIRSGDTVYALGRKSKSRWRVAIEHPQQQGTLTTVALRDKAVSTCGELDGYFLHENSRYTHVFDALTLTPAERYKSVSVIAEDAVTASALATVFFLMPENEIAETCQRTATPVMVYTAENVMLRFCGWQNYEN